MNFNTLKRTLQPSKHVKTIVLGHQKSGTTAIAALLAKSTGASYSNDPLYQIDRGLGLAANKLLSTPQKLNYYTHRHPILFGCDIIKDPDLIFTWPQINKVFERANYVFVLRDPRDNIRSICDRLALKGKNSTPIPSIKQLDRGNNHWHQIISGQLPPLSSSLSNNYIINLAKRWNHAATICAKNEDKMLIVKYEDFKANKGEVIHNLAEKLALPIKNDISKDLSKQFQKAGNSNIQWEDFYSQENLELIEEICAENMSHFGYNNSN
tara:strand:- start:5759 stop:6559 length:801 start_codon:yes stop_codon:yes gene_type:complete